MKRFVAVFLLLILLFNSFGYRIVSYALEQRADILLEESFDRDQIDESMLVEIKIPVRLPYQIERKEFERCDGEVEYKGVYYKYVKRKLEGDSLVLLCLPNSEKKIYQSTRDKVFQLVNNFKHPQEKKADNIFKNIITNYLIQDSNWKESLIPQIVNSCFNFGRFAIVPCALNKPAKPPQIQFS